MDKPKLIKCSTNKGKKLIQKYLATRHVYPIEDEEPQGTLLREGRSYTIAVYKKGSITYKSFPVHGSIYREFMPSKKCRKAKPVQKPNLWRDNIQELGKGKLVQIDMPSPYSIVFDRSGKKRPIRR